MSKYKSDVGTIYVTETKGADDPWDVWFEDFHIIGQGKSEIEALQDAARYTAGLSLLIATSLASCASVLRKEEVDLIVGANPLQALPEGGD
jgi:hypothetical protein